MRRIDEFLPRSPRTLTSWVELGFRVVALYVGIRVLIAVAVTTVTRVQYPYEIEWMEGAMVDHVARVVAGQPLYVAPRAEFVPYIYPPLYYWVSALAARFVGVGLPALRGVAVLAWGLSLLVLFDFVRRETHCWWAGLISVVLFVATFPATELWFGLARVDTLMLVLVLGACWLVRFRRGLSSAVVAGLLLVAACFTKQQAFLLALAPIGYTLFADRRRFFALALAALLVGLAALVALEAATDGWFWFYVFEAPRQHEWRWNEWHRFLLRHFWSTVGIHGVLAVAALAAPITTGRGWAKTVLYGGLWLMGNVSGYVSMLHTDGWVNVLIPAFAADALLAGLLIGWFSTRDDERWRSRALAVCHVAVLVALGLLHLRHERVRPTTEDRQAVAAALAKLRTLPGPVFSPGTGHYAQLAGHGETSAHNMAIRDVLKTGNDDIQDAMLDDITAKIKGHHYQTILLGDSAHVVPLRPLIRRHYRRDGSLFTSDHGHTRAGMAIRPNEIWVPRARPARRRERRRPEPTAP